MEAPYYNLGRVRRSIGYFLAGRALSAVASVVCVFVVVRLLSVESYADFATFIGMSLTVMLLAGGGLERVLPRFIPLLKEGGANRELKRWTWRLAIMRVALLAAVLLVVVIFLETFLDWFSIKNNQAAILGFYGYCIAQNFSLHVVQTLQALLLQRESMIGTAIEYCSRVVLLLSIWAVWGTVSLGDVMVVYAISAFLGFGYMVPALIRHLPSVDQALSNWKTTVAGRDVLATAWHNYSHGLLLVSMSPGVTRLIGAHVLGSAEMAALGFVLSIYTLATNYSPGRLLLGVIEPSLMAKHAREGNFRTLSENTSSIVKITCFIILPGSAWLYASGAPVVDLISSGKFGETTWLLAAFMLMIILDTNFMMCQLMANAVRRSRILFELGILSNFVVAVPIVCLIKFGLPGLVVGMYFVKTFRSYYILHRLRGGGHAFLMPWVSFAKMAGFSVCAAVIAERVCSLLDPSFLSSIVAAFIVSLIYLGLSFFWKPFTSDERSLINRSIGRPFFVW